MIFRIIICRTLLRAESHIDFRTQCVIKTVKGEGKRAITNDIMKSYFI